jgi:hypothetical protein
MASVLCPTLRVGAVRDQARGERSPETVQVNVVDLPTSVIHNPDFDSGLRRAADEGMIHARAMRQRCVLGADENMLTSEPFLYRCSDLRCAALAWLAVLRLGALTLENLPPSRSRLGTGPICNKHWRIQPKFGILL